MYCSFCKKKIVEENGTLLCNSKDSGATLFYCCTECQADILIMALDKIIENHYKILFRKFK